MPPGHRRYGTELGDEFMAVEHGCGVGGQEELKISKGQPCDCHGSGLFKY